MSIMFCIQFSFIIIVVDRGHEYIVPYLKVHGKTNSVQRTINVNNVLCHTKYEPHMNYRLHMNYIEYEPHMNYREYDTH